MIEGVRGDTTTSKEVMEKIGENQRENLSSIVKRLKPIEDSGAKSLTPKNRTIKTSAGFMLVNQHDQEETSQILLFVCSRLVFTRVLCI